MSMFKEIDKGETNLMIFTKMIINKIRFILIVLNLLLGLVLLFGGVPLSIIFIVNAMFILESYLKKKVAENVES